jgi:sulfatase maturation enzyme AslB (radical SAM superfamily)
MYYDFRFGNLCNLKCRSCGSLNSTQINKEYRELKQQYPSTSFFLDSGEKFDTLNDWYNTDQFKNNIYNHIDKIKKIYITGGEPTLIDENYKILNKLVEIDHAKNVTIMFNTNMTNLRDDFYELIVKFKHVEMCISIEGFGEVQEYLRYPANWNQIDKNIKKLASLPLNISIFAVPVIQSVNLKTITDFFKYIEDINNDYGFYRVRLLPIMLDSPQYLDLTILPTEYKIKCMAAIDEYLQTSNHFMNDVHFVGRLNHLRTKCQEEKYNPELLQRFKQFTEILDKERKQDLSKINPSLYSIIQNV